jgi:hypothetical protein
MIPSRFVLVALSMVACQISESRFQEVRADEECRIYGPECAGDYVSLAACLGDVPETGPYAEDLIFSPKNARECLSELVSICPVRAIDYVEPESCIHAYVAEE